MVMAGHHLCPPIKSQFTVVQSGECFPFQGLTQSKARSFNRFAGDAFQRVRIEGVQGLPLLEHHHIGDVHHSIHLVDPGSTEATLYPGWRGNAAVYFFDQADAVEASGCHRFGAFGRRLQRFVLWNQIEFRKRELSPRQSSHLTGDPHHRQTIRSVRCDRKVENSVIQAEHCGNGLAEGGEIGLEFIQHRNAIGITGQTQFRQRADHAVAGNPAQLSGFDREIG